MVGGRGEAKAQRRHPPQHRNRIAKHNSTETPVALKAPTFPLLSGCKPQDAGIKQSPRISTPTCCLQFCFIVPLGLAAYKIMFVLPLPLSILPLAAKTNTQQYSNTPIPELEKKKKENENLTAHMWPRNTNAQFLGEKKTAILCISPLLPLRHLSFPSHTEKPRGFLQSGILAKGSRTLADPNSRPFRPCSEVHVCSSGARRLGSRSATRELVCVPVLESLQSRNLVHLRFDLSSQWLH